MKKLLIIGFAGLAVYLFLRQSQALAATQPLAGTRFQYVIIGADGKEYNLIENNGVITDQSGRVWT